MRVRWVCYFVAGPSLGFTHRLADCFTDHRTPALVEHGVEELLKQRLYGLALGYEDLSDHETLSRDHLLAALVGKSDIVGAERRMAKDKNLPLASASTLGRLERTSATADSQTRYEKIVCDFDALGDLFMNMFIQGTEEPGVLILDLDPSDIQLHGEQEDRFYHGYYHGYCYLPMYVYCGDQPLAVQMRPANIDGAADSEKILEPIIAKLRQTWPEVRIIIRGDSGFCRDWLMTWCEANNLDYVFGMSRNSRLCKAVATQMEKARREFLRSGQPARYFRSFDYRTTTSPHKSPDR